MILDLGSGKKYSLPKQYHQSSSNQPCVLLLYGH